MKKPALNISIFSDYICPFCYIGNQRMDTLRAAYDLKINWCFVEIHPEIPPQGQSFDNLGYNEETREKLLSNLQQLAKEEGFSFHAPPFITNSRKALLLSQAVKSLGTDAFYPFHQQLFDDYFINGKNIGDKTVLRTIAQQHNIPESLIDKAWQDKYILGPAKSTPKTLLPFLNYAQKLQIKSVPSFIINDQILTGAVSREKLLNAAKNQTNN